MTVFPTSVMTALVDAPVRYDLAESTCPPVRVDELVDPAALADIALGYGTTQGDADLRDLIAAATGVGADRVLLTIGGMQAMFLLVQTVCGPGDRMLLPSPYFPPARTIPEALGVPVDVVPLSFDEGYRLPLDRIAAALTPHTRLVSLASPQNPSGIRVTDDEVRAVLMVVADRAPDAVVLVDESFRESTYGAAPAPPSFAPASPRIVTCSSLSKAYGAPGLRIGWLTVTDPDLLGRLREGKFQTTIACPTVDEHLAAAVLRRRSEILPPRAKRLRQALDELLRWTRVNRLEMVVPDGGAMCCLRLPVERYTDDGVAAFHRGLPERDTRVAPGSWFGETDRVFRLGFGHLPADDFSAALERLADAL